MIIKNSLVFTEDCKFEAHDIVIENGYFSDASTSSDEVMEGQDCYAIPGLIDIHLHGCMGQDFCDGTKEAIEMIVAYEASVGVTTIVPATMTLSEKELLHIMKTAAAYTQQKEQNKGATFAGINMEGPFISEAKKGSQAAEYIRCCDLQMFKNLQYAANGLIKLVDIAPEEPGAIEFIKAVKDEVVVSLAHTKANYNIAKEAFEYGAKHVTHLYNAMPPFSHREPGVIGAAYDSKKCMVELICDGIHIHPSVVRATFEMFGKNRVIMISDSMRATGMPDGRYTLGGQEVEVVGKRASLVSNGALAGSTTNLMECVKIAVNQMDIPLETVIASATINPAKAVGIDKEYGSITKGKRGNVVLLNKDLSMKAVIIDGKILSV